MVDGEDAGRAWPVGEVGQLGTSVNQSLKAVVTQSDGGPGCSRVVGAGVSNCHTEALGDRGG